MAPCPEFAANAGQQNAVWAGMVTARDWGADCIISLDADLRDQASSPVSGGKDAMSPLRRLLACGRKLTGLGLACELAMPVTAVLVTVVVHALCRFGVFRQCGGRSAPS
ncbi:hypothetical protein [uncultured Desulfovibrio sp.]|uniref:hypothetical protein n=1 Tax=uncultured Desulfovibrio sp. TaxID=167968 RepID=UPI00263762FE|nr:hypothetical protein [uncultured Desulfovibrio sp.]